MNLTILLALAAAAAVAACGPLDVAMNSPTRISRTTTRVTTTLRPRRRLATIAVPSSPPPTAVTRPACRDTVTGATASPCRAIRSIVPQRSQRGDEQHHAQQVRGRRGQREGGQRTL